MHSERKNELPVYRVFRLVWWSSLFPTSTYYHFQENIIHGYGLDFQGAISSNKIFFSLHCHIKTSSYSINMRSQVA